MIIQVYRGSSHAKEIVRDGFDVSKIGTGWGLTYGRGIYFTRDIREAQCYGPDILVCSIRYKPYTLCREYTPKRKQDTRELQALRDMAIEQGYSCFENKSGSEIIVFDTKDIVSIDIHEAVYT